LIAIEYEEMWLKGSPLERLTAMVESMFRKNILALKKFNSKWPEQTLILEFEQFVQ